MGMGLHNRRLRLRPVWGVLYNIRKGGDTEVEREEGRPRKTTRGPDVLDFLHTIFFISVIVSLTDSVVHIKIWTEPTCRVEISVLYIFLPLAFFLTLFSFSSFHLKVRRQQCL